MRCQAMRCAAMGLRFVVRSRGFHVAEGREGGRGVAPGLNRTAVVRMLDVRVEAPSLGGWSGRSLESSSFLLTQSSLYGANAVRYSGGNNAARGMRCSNAIRDGQL